MDRGTYCNPQRGRQLIRFDGMNYAGNITPTDIDGVIEYHDNVWIIWEVKIVGKLVPHGQRLTLERFVSDMSRAGKFAIAMVVEHNEDNPLDDIFLRDCYVREFISTETCQRYWRPPNRRMTAKEMADIYINLHGEYKKKGENYA